MNKGCFVTGTDTGVGKTFITAGLIKLLADSGVNVAGMKPVASGCEQTDQGLRNDDADLIMQQSNLDLAYKLINPYAFKPPVSPHFAAKDLDQKIDLDTIVDKFSTISEMADFVIVEGVGGWQVPVNDDQTMSDLAEKLGLPVIMVVGLRLGCINHALLTAESISAKGLSLVACVANQIDPDYQRREETIETLEQRLEIPVQYVPYLDQNIRDQIEKERLMPEQITDYLEETKNQIL